MSGRSIGTACLAAASLVTGTLPLAQGSRWLATDRPNFVESSLAVGEGVFQFEVGIAGSETDLPGGDLEEWATPTLLRYGVTRAWELRLETAGYLRSKQDDQTDSGLADVAVGAKWHARDGETGTADPSMSVLLNVGLETGSSAFRLPGPRPSVRAVAEWTVGERLGVGAMGGLRSARNRVGDRYVHGILGLVASYGFPANVRPFVEFAAPAIRSNDDGGNLVFWDAGVTWAFDPNWQADAAVNLGANADSPDRLITIGLSGRFGYR